MPITVIRNGVVVPAKENKRVEEESEARLTAWDAYRAEHDIEEDCGCIDEEVARCFDSWIAIPRSKEWDDLSPGVLQLIQYHFSGNYDIVHYQDEAIRVLVELLQLIHIEDTKPELDLS